MSTQRGMSGSHSQAEDCGPDCDWCAGLRAFTNGGALCEQAGHEWGEASGGLLICLRCEAEKWDNA